MVAPPPLCPNLSTGFFFKSLVIRSLAWLLKLNYYGNTISDSIIALNNKDWLDEKNGGLPTNISYIKIPKDHQSTSKLCPFYLIISGAKYSGVPTKENVFSPYFKNFANP